MTFTVVISAENTRAEGGSPNEPAQIEFAFVEPGITMQEVAPVDFSVVGKQKRKSVHRRGLMSWLIGRTRR